MKDRMKIIGTTWLLLASVVLVLFSLPAADATGYQFSGVYYYNPIWWKNGNTATAHFSGDLTGTPAMTKCSSPG